MNNLIGAIRVSSRCKNIFNYTECKRFAGHSKWSNIRHIKAEKDGQRHAAMISVMRQVKLAIAEGKSAKLSDNPKLAKLIENAKRQSLPISTIKAYLEKVQNTPNRDQSLVVQARGPAGSVILVHLVTDNVNRAKNEVNHCLKKLKLGPCEPLTKSTFEQKAVIVTEADNISLDKATEDAIEVGAEEAEKGEHEGKEFFQFLCQTHDLFKVRNALEDRSYKIIQADVEYLPIACVTLTRDDDLQKFDKLYEKLNALEEVYKLYNNIA